MTCKFQSVLFLTDSQSALSILSSAPSYLLPESLWNVWSLASSLSNNTTLSFQWVPGHSGLPGNEKADFLAKTGASLPTDAIPSPLPPVIAKVRYSQYRNWRRHISHSHLNFQVPEVSPEELLLYRSIRTELSRLRCHGHSLLLSSQDQSEGEFWLQCLWTPSTGPQSSPPRLSCFWTPSQIYLWLLSFYSRSMVQTLGCGPTVGSPRSFSAPPSLGRGRVVPLPPLSLTNSLALISTNTFCNRAIKRAKLFVFRVATTCNDRYQRLQFEQCACHCYFLRHQFLVIRIDVTCYVKGSKITH